MQKESVVAGIKLGSGILRGCLGLSDERWGVPLYNRRNQLRRNDLNLPESRCNLLLHSAAHFGKYIFLCHDSAAIDEAALFLQRANAVYCLGQGGSMVLANDIWVRFATISNKFRNCGDSHTQLIAASLMGPGDVILFVSYSGSTHDMMDTLTIAKNAGAKIILITHYADAPGTSLADVVLLCGALETPLDGGSIPVKVGELFVAESLIMRYLLDNKELATIARDKTSTAMVVKLL